VNERNEIAKEEKNRIRKKFRVKFFIKNKLSKQKTRKNQKNEENIATDKYSLAFRLIPA
jgi:hypothetical protein